GGFPRSRLPHRPPHGRARAAAGLRAASKKKPAWKPGRQVLTGRLRASRAEGRTSGGAIAAEVSGRGQKLVEDAATQHLTGSDVIPAPPFENPRIVKPAMRLLRN